MSFYQFKGDLDDLLLKISDELDVINTDVLRSSSNIISNIESILDDAILMIENFEGDEFMNADDYKYLQNMEDLCNDAFFKIEYSTNSSSSILVSDLRNILRKLV